MSVVYYLIHHNFVYSLRVKIVLLRAHLYKMFITRCNIGVKQGSFASEENKKKNKLSLSWLHKVYDHD